MWECSYSREPVDFRLLWLRFVKKIWIIGVATVLAALLFTAIYVGATFAKKGGRLYRVTDVLDITYPNDGYELEVDYFYFNYYTWNQVSDYDSVVDAVYEEMKGELTREQIIAATEATLVSDVHHLYLHTDTNDVELSKRLSEAFRKAIEQFIDEYDRMTGYRPLTLGDVSDITNLRVLRAVVTGGIIGFCVSILGVVIALLTDGSVWIPSTLEKRYHVPTLTAASMEEFKVNCDTMLEGLHNIACVAVDEKSKPEKELFANKEVSVFGNFTGSASELQAIKACDACVVCVAAGAHNASRIERTLEQLGRNGIKVLATMLVAEDSKLIKHYYR